MRKMVYKVAAMIMTAALFMPGVSVTAMASDTEISEAASEAAGNEDPKTDSEDLLEEDNDKEDESEDEDPIEETGKESDEDETEKKTEPVEEQTEEEDKKEETKKKDQEEKDEDAEKAKFPEKETDNQHILTDIEKEQVDLLKKEDSEIEKKAVLDKDSTEKADLLLEKKLKEEKSLELVDLEEKIEFTLESMPDEEASYIKDTYGEKVLNTYDIVVPEGTEFPVQISFEASVKEGQAVILYHFTGDEWEEITPDNVGEGTVTATFNSLSPVAVVDNTEPEEIKEKKIITVDGTDYDVTDAECWDISYRQNGQMLAYHFRQDDTDYVLISGSGSMKDYYFNDRFGEKSPLWDLPDYTVIWDDHGIYSIGSYFFQNYGDDESLKGTITSLPQNLYRIEAYAFGGSRFNAEIPDSVKRIHAYAFDGCAELTISSVPDSLTYLGVGAFRNCPGITHMNIPSYMNKIPERLFDGCKNLEEVTFPGPIKEIGRYAFFYCENLKMNKLPDGLTKIEEAGFMGCKSLTVDTLPDSIRFLDLYAFNGSGVTISEIPSDLTYMGPYAFRHCNNITSMDFSASNTIYEIPKAAFEGCSNLSSVVIPGNINNIDNSAFSNCVRLTDITASGNAEVGNKVFYVNPEGAGNSNSSTGDDTTYSIPFKTSLHGDATWLSTYDFKADNRLTGSYTVTLPMSVDLSMEEGELRGSIDLQIDNDTNGWDIQILENVSKHLTSDSGDVITMSLERGNESQIYGKDMEKEIVNIRAVAENMRDAVYKGVITFTTGIMVQ